MIPDPVRHLQVLDLAGASESDEVRSGPSPTAPSQAWQVPFTGAAAQACVLGADDRYHDRAARQIKTCCCWHQVPGLEGMAGGPAL